MNELREAFFSLPPQKLAHLLKIYGEQYGENAASYAEKSYPTWKNGSVRMSAQTWLRLIRTLPKFLTAQQKILLAQKLLEFYCKKVKTYQRGLKSVDATWDNFDLQIEKTIIELQKLSWENELAKQWDKIIPKEVQDVASWIYDDDVSMVKKIMEEFLHKKALLALTNGINDLEKFRWQCRWMLEQKHIYEDMYLAINLPDMDIFVTVHRAKKSILQRFIDLF